MKTIFLTLLFVLVLEAKERIVSLSPSITEIIFALQKAQDLVAVSDYSLYPKEAQSLPIVGSYLNPHFEKIVARSPTLVVAQDFNKEILENLEHFGIKTLTLKLQTIEDIKSSIIKLSNELKADPKTLINEIDDAIKSAQKSKISQKVLIVYGLYEDLAGGIYVAGNDIFFNDIISLCGNTNAYTANLTNQPVLSYENVIAINPDRIIILHSKASNPNVDKEKALSSWHRIPTNASKNGRITIVEESYINIPSHRVALTIKRLCGEMGR